MSCSQSDHNRVSSYIPPPDNDAVFPDLPCPFLSLNDDVPQVRVLPSVLQNVCKYSVLPLGTDPKVGLCHPFDHLSSAKRLRMLTPLEKSEEDQHPKRYLRVRGGAEMFVCCLRDEL